METFITFILSSAIIAFFLRNYLKSIADGNSQNTPSPTPTSMTRNCPKCGSPVRKGAAFCDHCGIPMKMWEIKSAAAKTTDAPTGEDAEARIHPLINASMCVGCGSCVDACPEDGVLDVIGGKAQVINLPACMGHGSCADVCPTSAIVLVKGDQVRTVEVPQIDEKFETNVRGIYIVGELGGMALIKNAVNEGKLAIDHIYEEIKGEVKTPGVTDVAIIGAGPAGLSASLTAKQYGLSYITLEQGELASTIRQYPRHKLVMAEPIEIPMYGSLWMNEAEKETLLEVWETIIRNTEVEIRTNERVTNVMRENGYFMVRSTKGEYKARRVVLAVGKRGTPRKLGVPGEELSKVVYKLIEAESYVSSYILIVGGGDSALEAAIGLSKQPGNTVYLSYRGSEFRRAKARNVERIQQAIESGAVIPLLNSQVTEITAKEVTLTINGNETKKIPNDYVFVMIGGEPPTAFLQKLGVEIVTKVV